MSLKDEVFLKLWDSSEINKYAIGLRERAEGYEMCFRQGHDLEDFEKAQKIRASLGELATFACRQILYGGKQ